jgi:hypothetical protein
MVVGPLLSKLQEVAVETREVVFEAEDAIDQFYLQADLSCRTFRPQHPHAHPVLERTPRGHRRQ